MNSITTDGCSFIGNHITDRLLHDGHHVTVLDIWQSPAVDAHAKNLRMKFVTDNILDDRITTELLRGKDGLIHAAAILGTSETITEVPMQLAASLTSGRHKSRLRH